MKGMQTLRIEAIRNDDLRGVRLNVRLTVRDNPPARKGDWNMDYSVSVGNSNHVSASGGGSITDDDWHDFDKEVAKALKSPASTPLVIIGSLR